MLRRPANKSRSNKAEVLKDLPPVDGKVGGPTRKGGWTAEEDEILRRAVSFHGGRNWKKIASYFEGRTDVQCLHRWQKVLNPELVKGQWSKEEDEKIVQLVAKYGAKKWSLIAAELPGRIGKQCRERWHNHLNPDIKKTDWTPEEDELLIKLHAELGNQWAKLAQRLEGRTDNAIKNHWNSTLRRRLEDGEFDYLFQPNAQAAPAQASKKTPKQEPSRQQQQAGPSKAAAPAASAAAAAAAAPAAAPSTAAGSPTLSSEESDEEEPEEPLPSRRSRSMSLRPPTAPSSLGNGFSRSSSRDLPSLHFSLFGSAPPLFMDPKQQSARRSKQDDPAAAMAAAAAAGAAAGSNLAVPPKKRVRMGSESGTAAAGAQQGHAASALDLQALNRQSGNGSAPGRAGAQEPAAAGSTHSEDLSDAQHSEATDSEATKTQLTPAKRRRPAQSEAEAISQLLRSGAKSLTSSPSLFAKLKAAAAVPPMQTMSCSGRDVSMVDQADPSACPATPAVTSAQSGDLLQLNYSTPYPLLYRHRRESMDDGAAAGDAKAALAAGTAKQTKQQRQRSSSDGGEAAMPTPSSGPAKRSAAKAAPACTWTPSHASLLDYLKEVSMDGSLFNPALNNAASNAGPSATAAAAAAAAPAAAGSTHNSALPSPPPLNPKGGLVNTAPITQLLQQHLPFKSQLFATTDKAGHTISFIAPVSMSGALNNALQAAANSRPSSRGSNGDVAPQVDQKELSAAAAAPKLSIPSLNTGTTAVAAAPQEQNLQQVLQALSNSSQLNLQQLLLAVSNQAQPLYMLAEQVLQQPSNLPRSSANIAVQASPMDIDVQCTASKSNAGDSATATDSRTQCHWETSGTAGPLANTSQEAEQAIAVK